MAQAPPAGRWGLGGQKHGQMFAFWVRSLQRPVQSTAWRLSGSLANPIRKGGRQVLEKEGNYAVGA